LNTQNRSAGHAIGRTGQYTGVPRNGANIRVVLTGAAGAIGEVNKQARLNYALLVWMCQC